MNSSQPISSLITEAASFLEHLHSENHDHNSLEQLFLIVSRKEGGRKWNAEETETETEAVW